MDRVKLNVIVEGPLKSGKSTLMRIIAKALKDNGFKVTNKDDDKQDSLPHTNRIKAVSERVEVDIVPMQRRPA